MDQDRFDDLARLLGARGTRRAGVRAALGAVGVAMGLGMGAAPDAAAKHRRRKRCDPACAAGQSCDRATRTCRCDDGGTACGAACCRIGQECRDGACVEMPEPTTCIAFGEPCKNVGAPCCENLQCGSGQGGGEIACWVRKTGRCTSTAECIYGTECKDGICVGPPQPQPAPTCVVAQCPNCPGLDGGEESILEKVCIDGACSCTCIQFSILTGVNCRNDDDCTVGEVTYACLDSEDLNERCGADSAYCCCASI